MARSKNQAETVKLTISTTSQVKAFLDLLVKSGRYGKTPSEAGERVLCEALDLRLKGADPLARNLQELMKGWLRSA